MQNNQSQEELKNIHQEQRVLVSLDVPTENLN